jgi:hypothetical protein
MSACSNNSNRAVTATVGVDTGVTLTTAGSATSLLAGSTLALGATVSNASSNAGVTWALLGEGSLTDITATSATYNAPASVTGATTALITATAVANAQQIGSVGLIVLGTPLIDNETLFPANVNVPYQASVSAAGGDAPFTWVVLSGALPPGLVLSGSTGAVTNIQGTPTTTGTFSFTLQATDTLARVATVDMSMVVNAQAACVLSGNFTFQFSGFRGGGAASHTGAITIDSIGDVTGEQDYKDPTRTTTAETLTSGTCINRETNTGVLTLKAPSGQLVYNFAATPPDVNGVIHSARLQLISSGGDSGSGLMTLQDATAITAAPPSGGFAFGLIGVEGSGVHFGTAGRFTADTTGTLSTGLIDSNDPVNTLTNASMTGTVTAPDANGRGTVTLTSGTFSSTLAYYTVGAGKAFLMDIDSGKGTASAIGQMTAQVGDASPTTFDNGAMATPSILSLFGAAQSAEPVTVMSLGRLSNANPAAGTLDVGLDTSDQATDISDEPFTAQPYSVGTSGRGLLTLTDPNGIISLTFYLDGMSNGYVVVHGSSAGSAGLLEQQFQGPYANPPPTGIFPATQNNAFVSGTAFPQAPGPISLEPLVFLNFDQISSNFFNGSFAIDANTGRGLGTVVDNGIGTSAGALYIVSPTKMDLLRYGTRAVDGSIEFMIQN